MLTSKFSRTPRHGNDRATSNGSLVLRQCLGFGLGACVLLTFAAFAEAACTWTWDCTNGQCQQLPLCDYSSEIPPLRPLETPPVAAPSLRPIQPHVFAPPGKRACREAYICSNNGECRWKSVCE